MTDRRTERDGQHADRGRHAERPSDIPARGWRDILARVKVESNEDGAVLLASGVAFWGLMALVPGLVALISIYGLVAQPDEVRQQIASTLRAAPAEVRNLVASQLESIVGASGGRVGLGLAVGVVLALWSASSGIGHLIDAINRAYDEQETRGWLCRKAVAVGFTVGAVMFMAGALTIIAFLPSMVQDWGPAARITVSVARWVLLLGGMVLGLTILYRYGPDRDAPKWKWASAGAVVAAVLFVLGSVLFSVYTANFAKYNETYGSLGAVVVLLLWLFLTAFAVIIGAEINCEMERQTRRDTTVGAPQPMGDRRAIAADTLGATADEVKSTGQTGPVRRGAVVETPQPITTTPQAPLEPPHPALRALGWIAVLAAAWRGRPDA